MSESNIQTDILNYVKARGAYAFKKHSDAISGAGVSDVVCGYKGFYIAFEVKEPDGTISPIQRHHLREVQKAGNIGEAVRSVKRVKEVLDCIDRGDKWENTRY